MKPTRNQLLAACALDGNLSEIECAEALCDTITSLGPDMLVATLKELTSYTELRLHVEIKPRSEAEQSLVWDSVQVPIEPFKDKYSQALALAWCVNEKRACELVPFLSEPNLLVQAVRAQLRINRFEVKHVVDKATKLTKEVQFLDRGSVLLAFELAGLPAPKSYDDWRLPDGDNVPLQATSTDSSLGTMTVHYTNGELALVTSGDGMRAKVVHVKSLRSSAAEIVRGLSGRAEGATVRESKEKLTQADAKALASKFCRKMKVEVAA